MQSNIVKLTVEFDKAKWEALDDYEREQLVSRVGATIDAAFDATFIEAETEHTQETTIQVSTEDATWIGDAIDVNPGTYLFWHSVLFASRVARDEALKRAQTYGRGALADPRGDLVIDFAPAYQIGLIK